MILRAAALVACLAAVPVLAQDTPAVPFDQIVACVRVTNCKNMKVSSLNWYDQVGIPVMTFNDGGWTYALRSAAPRASGPPESLGIWLTPPGESRPSRLLTLDMTGQLVGGELGPLPGDAAPQRMTSEEFAAWRQLHKVFQSPARTPRGEAYGNEFKPFWQELADQALAAVVRAIRGSWRPATPPKSSQHRASV